MPLTAQGLVAELEAAADPAAHPNRHYRGAARVMGVRMGTVFDIAKAFAALPLDEVGRLLDEEPYEARLAAFCVLDFAVRSPRMADADREQRFRLYLDRHDRIDSWDMVDRAAPRVVGGFLKGRPRDDLFDLAASPDPLRRRTAMTAPLAYTRPPDLDGIEDLLRIAELLAGDSDPLVSKPVGIALKHAGAAGPDLVRAFLERMGERLPAPVRREARAKLS
ncbi:DNA alkylation repair protein [Microlunatus parietis]|uniref:3-methyladenine DNA glycosylase AlkD n=1 Tax=Microlunatus parietis TaxID=682979 RepID=A0A7Y9I480_9ACTN|nr:DNA alkylation repair protein [Microlunatus parietis]NYE69952.1 3-methyladenine DNA glycosylase AlkD [Microlunatus parietis]